MNFENMPELKTEAGYFVVLSFMLALAVTLLIFFRRLGWIGTGKTKIRKKK
jgi:magnesium transporter